MTDSIKVKLDLSHLPKTVLKGVPVEVVYREAITRPRSIIPFAPKQAWKSPLTGNAMQIKVLHDEQFAPIALVADFNIPNATVGQNAELGHSVYAACTVALGLFKIFLAQHGVPMEDLDRLSLAELRLGSCTVTYLLPVPKGRTSQDIIEDVGRRYSQFFPLSADGRYGGTVVGSKDSQTAYCRKRGWETRVYSTPAHKIPGHDDCDLRRNQIAFARNVIRMELTLTLEELRKQGLYDVDAWQGAHADGTYKRLFDTYIRDASLRLNERLRQDRPDATDVSKLSTVNQHVIAGYLDGKLLENCEILKRPTKLAMQKVMSATRTKILKQLRIDIDIDWREHRKLGNRWMDKVIVYPGDHHPPLERIEGAFCRDNLSMITQQLQAALARGVRPVYAAAGSLDPAMGDDGLD